MATEKVVIPDFGDVQDITVVEVYVTVGDTVDVEDSLIALESEKAVMDIPSPVSGVVKEIYVSADDSVKSGDQIALIEVAGEDAETEEKVTTEKSSEKDDGVSDTEPSGEKEADSKEQNGIRKEPAAQDIPEEKAGNYHATPSVRTYARELEIDLSEIKGTGPKGRIQKEDLLKFVKERMRSKPQTDTPSLFAEKPLEDFSRYGDIEEMGLSRIKKISGPHLQKNWVTIPHVTHFDEADVTELENFRRQMNEEGAADGVRYSPLVFIVKAVVASLKEFPLFNSSLVPGGEKVILKHFYNIGIAVDTPEGLVVPVIKDAEKKGIKEIAVELKKLSDTAREGKLGITDIQGASFTISSLGGIGGTGFTPIINAPQVAILGLSKYYLKPVWHKEKQSFVPRLTLPFSLSYDHRVIDGAEAARFCSALSKDIEDLRRAL